ncbi:hypothetical protein V2A60_001075 [Cordyceps javanica]|uniref:Myb-like domain-containing protein n=1 Tax=Cordyceps javanica TaxID=43265 RepID=A0A545V2F8_9HYPO|nr:hypothetical protein IF1G_05738 [Cordyceps javanica]TQW06891.1 myb-like DNA-binding domain-containing protein [Cordyceps javanica]
MLLPSALPCDRTRGMVSPPASPPKLSTPATFNIASSCFSLQSLIANTATENQQYQYHQQQEQYYNHNHNYNYNHSYNHNHSYAQQQQQQQQDQSYFGGALLPRPLPTPPMAHTPSPMKLRLRTNTSNTREESKTRRVVKRTASPRHKRAPHLSGAGSDSNEAATDNKNNSNNRMSPGPPTTPERSRIAPERMPLGLARADFHNLYEAQPQDAAAAASDWTAEDDRILVELVLEKLKLSRADWQDCARTLGKDRHVLSRRWKSLVLNDDVGLKRRRVPSTWR